MPAYRENSVKGKVVIVTGANSGLGKSTAFEMAKRGATVVLACRNLDEGQRAVNEIKARNASGTLVLLHLDLADLSSVRKFAAVVKARY
jgi:NAD(P)-dependent dehydrogenase (short-subunit alcohol dehydrogenase family)